LGAEPPAGSRSRAPGQGGEMFGGRVPPIIAAPGNTSEIRTCDHKIMALVFDTETTDAICLNVFLKLIIHIYIYIAQTSDR